MSSKRIPNLKKELEEIWHQVPPDYYQNGVSKNLLQRIWHTRKLRNVLKLVDDAGICPKNILDVGCASGWFLSRVKLRYPKSRCIGVDIYKKAIEYGKKHYKSLKLIHTDAHTLPFIDKSFDLVICTEVLEHVVSPEKVLKEIERVLSPRGTVIIEMDTGSFLFKVVWHWWTNMMRGVWKDSHIHMFNTTILQNMIKKNGFLITGKRIFNLTMGVAFCLEKKEHK